MAPKKTLRVGMIGYQFMGKAHSNAWRQAPRFFDLPAHIELHTICGRSPAALEHARETLGWEYATTEWRNVVSDPAIDIIDICTPNDSHAEIAIEAARRGKAILCEKPLALNLPQARAMAAAVKKARVVNMVCHNYRRIPAIALARRMIDDGAIGDRIYHYSARYAQDWLADPKAPFGWRVDAGISGSGANGDINAHIIDLARYLVGEFAEVTGLMETFVRERPLPKPSGSRKMARVRVDDCVSWVGRFKNGAIANLEATRFATGRKNHIAIEINGNKGALAFDFEDMNRLEYFDATQPADRRGFRSILATDASQPYFSAYWPPGHIIGYEHTFINTVADFIRAVVSGKSVHPTFEDGLRNQTVMNAVAQSAKTRKWVKINSKIA